jgi:hypothetical protein
MAQSKNIHPGHPVKTTSIPSDSKSAIGCGSATKGGSVNTTSLALNRGEGKGYGAGSMASGRPRPVSKSPC